MNRKNLIDVSKKSKAKSPKRPNPKPQTLLATKSKNLIEIYNTKPNNAQLVTDLPDPQKDPTIQSSNNTAINRTETIYPSPKNKSLSPKSSSRSPGRSDHSNYSENYDSQSPRLATSQTKVQTSTSLDFQPQGLDPMDLFRKSQFSGLSQETSIDLAYEFAIDSK
jgi:hypothetical protein